MQLMLQGSILSGKQAVVLATTTLTVIAALFAVVVASTTCPQDEPTCPANPPSPVEQPPPGAPTANIAKMGVSGSKTSSNWKALHGKGAEKNTAVFGAGCYWGTEAYFVKKFGDASTGGALEATAVGFMGPEGAWANPTYSQVCTGESGHVEVLSMKYNPDKATYRDLCKHFFTFHDPTTMNRQGNDRGPQYASAIFYMDEEQKKIAEEVISDMNERLAAGSIKFSGFGKYSQKKITTAVLPATKFYAAHEEHQRYLEANPSGYCNHGVRFKWEDQK